MRFLRYIKICINLCVIGTAGSASLYAAESLHMVTVTVILADETPVMGATVKLMPGAYTGLTDSYGKFTLTSIPAGEYHISVSMPYMGLEDFHRRISVPYQEQRPLIIVMQPRTYQVDEIVVLSDKQDVHEKTEKIPPFVTIVERSEFENTSTTVADIVTATPSANITVMGGLGDFTELSLRGSYSNQVQVYIDGMLLNEAVGGAVNLAAIPLTQVQSVEVWRSGSPSRFGSDAAGGVINITTRDSLTPEKTLSLGYGAYNTVTANTVINIPLRTSRFHVTADYAASDNNFTYKSDNGTMYNREDDYWARRKNDEFRTANLMSRYSHLFANGMLLELSEHLLSNKKNLPGKDTIRNSDASLETTKNLFQAKMTLNPFNKNNLELQPRFYHIINHEHYRDIRGTIGWGFEDNIYDTQTYNLLIPFSVRINNYAEITITPGAKHESYRPENRLQETVPLSSAREQLTLAGDAVIKTPGERLTVTSNMRRDRYFSSFSGQPSAINRITPKSVFNYLTTLQAGIRIRVWRNLFIQGNCGDVTRIPSLYELFGDRGNTISNQNLKPEHIFRCDVGGKLRIINKNLPITGSVEYAYFTNQYRNLIQWYTTDVGFIQPDNVGGSYVKGNEIVWSGKILNRFSCLGNWTFQQSKVTDEKRKYYRNKKLPNRPENYGNIKIEYPFGHFIPFWSMNHKSSYLLDRANQPHKRYPGRNLQDIGITISLMGGITTCTGMIKNVTDIHTFDIQGMPKPGRSYMITVIYSIQ